MDYVVWLYLAIHLCKVCSSMQHSYMKNPSFRANFDNGRHSYNSSQEDNAAHAHVVGVVGGKHVKNIRQFPSIACLVIKETWGEDFRGAATIISKHWVVTAAHCMIYLTEFDIRSKNAFVHSGSRYWEKDFTKHLIVQSYSHEKYNDDIADFDVAVVKVKEAFSGHNEKPINVAPSNYRYVHNSVVTTVGWGMTNNAVSPYVSEDLSFVHIKLLHHKMCSRVFKPQDSKITDQMVCASAPGKDACFNDSGGPLYQNNTLIGIVSWGPEKCADRVLPGVYTKISVVRDWIFKTIKDDRSRRILEDS